MCGGGSGQVFWRMEGMSNPDPNPPTRLFNTPLMATDVLDSHKQIIINKLNFKL